MATLGKGYTFGAAESVTNTKLHTLVESGSVSGLTQSDVAASEGLAVRSASSPSDTDAVWVDTSFTPPIVRVHDGSNWIPVSPGIARLTNKSGAQRVAGDVCIIDTTADDSFTTTTSEGSAGGKVVVLETIADDAAGLVAVSGGPFTIKTVGTVTRGNLLVTSTTETRAKPEAAPTDGVFAVAMSAVASGNGTVSAIIFGVGDGANATPTFGTPALTYDSSNAAGASSSAIRTDATIDVLSDTAASTQSHGDSASAGTGGNASREDHKHAMPEGGFSNIEAFTASGTWTKPSNVSKVYVEAWGGGGGGGGGGDSNGGTKGGGSGGSGGGAGEYAAAIIAVTGDVTVTIGSGGAAAAKEAAGAAGGDTTFVGTTTLTANGGSGGGAGVSASAAGGDPGKGGGAGGTGSTNTVAVDGGDGGTSGTGGGLTDSEPGGCGGHGGQAPRGGGGGSGGVPATAGVAGNQPGGGGGGGGGGAAGGTANTGGAASAAGAAGMCIVYWNED